MTLDSTMPIASHVPAEFVQQFHQANQLIIEQAAKIEQLYKMNVKLSEENKNIFNLANEACKMFRDHIQTSKEDRLREYENHWSSYIFRIIGKVCLFVKDLCCCNIYPLNKK